MKRFVLFFIIVNMCLCQHTPIFASEPVSNQQYPPCVIADFETGIESISSHEGCSIAYSQDGHGANSGACKVVQNESNGSPQFNFASPKHVTYDLSVWIKPEQTPLTDQVQFIIYTFKEGTSIWIYNVVTVNEVGLIQGEWVKVSASFYYDGTGRQAGVGQTDGSDVSFLQLRIGDGSLGSITQEDHFTYYMDDMSIVPQPNYAKVTENNIVFNGDFETDPYLESWVHDSQICTTEEIGGAAGTASAVQVSVTGDYGMLIQKNVDLRFGRKYCISFYAKAVSEEAVGSDFCMILSRIETKQDPNVKNYEYLYTENGLTTEWKKYEISYYYPLSTTDTCKVDIGFRAGNGVERITYAVDQVEIYEVTDAYRILFSGDEYKQEDVSYLTLHGYHNCCTFIYQVIESSEKGDMILESGKVADKETIQWIDGGNRRVDIIPMDSYGGVGEKKSFCGPENVDEGFGVRYLTNAWTDDTSKICVTVKNNRSFTEEQTVQGILAQYDENGALLYVEISELAFSNNKYAYDLNFTVVNNSTLAKFFLFNSLTDLQPLKHAKSIYKCIGQCIYVDGQNGNDNAPGTAIEPLKSFAGAKIKVAQLLSLNGTEDIYVIFRDGNYFIEDTLVFDDADGSENINICYMAENTGKSTITGGKLVSGFSLYDESAGIYRAYVGENVQSRQFFVNGVRATRAKSAGMLKGAANIGTNGITTTDLSLLEYQNISDLELVFYEKWTNPRCGVESIRQEGDKAVLTMKQPAWKYVTGKGATSATIPVWYENSYELLDEEGEWYLDRGAGYIYYKPRTGENLSEAECVLPVTEKLMIMTNSMTQIYTDKNIQFKGLEFSYTTWNYPTVVGGLSDAQNNLLREPGSGLDEDRLCDGAIEINYSQNISFENCTFSKLGIIGIKMTEGAQKIDIIGCEFSDISGSAIAVGESSVSNENYYNPSSYQQYVSDIHINNNRIHAIGVEYQSSSAISVGFPKNCSISHNEVYDIPYSGIHVGLGWGNLEEVGSFGIEITNNYIHSIMNSNLYDGGAIYTNGPTAASTDDMNKICGNYIKNQYMVNGAIYNDEGSSFWQVSDNVIDLSENSIWVMTNTDGSGYVSVPVAIYENTVSAKNNQYYNNYATTDYAVFGTNGSLSELPNMFSSNEWPVEAKIIIQNAGITEEFKDNFNSWESNDDTVD